MANRNDDWANDPRFDRRPDWGVDLDQPRWESRDFVTNQPYRERAEVEGYRNYPPVHYWDRPGGQGWGGGSRQWEPGSAREGYCSEGWNRGYGSAPWSGRENWRMQNWGPGEWRSRGDIGPYDRGYSAFSGEGEGREYGGSYRGPREFGGNRLTYENTGGMGRFAGRGPRGYHRSDDRIREEVCEILTRHGDIDAGDVEVQVKNGEVTLTGNVDDRYQKRLAEDVVEQVSGVHDVHNQIRVQQRASESTARGGEERISPTGSTSREGRRRAA